MNTMYKLISAFAAVIILSSIAPNGVDAAANMETSDQKQMQRGYDHNQNQSMDRGFVNFLHNYFNKWNSQWDNRKENKHEQSEESEQPEKNEQPESEETTQPSQKDNEEANEPKEPQQDESSELNQFEQQVVQLTNVEREKHGLAALQTDHALSKVARDKSQDMQMNGYFAHNSPTYGSPFDMMKSYGIDYRTAGENIAKGQRTPEEVVNAWMNSEGHRENILNGNFTHIGVGYIQNGNVWTQQFIGK